MLRAFAWRLASVIALLVVSSSLVFFALSFAGGDPAQVILRESMTEESAAAIRAQLGLDDPLLVQYGRFLSGLLLEFDLGRSWYTHKPVLDDLLEAFPYTIALTLAGALVAILIGVPLGIVAAVHQGTWRDEAAKIFMLAGVSLPNFVLALLAIILFGSWLRLFPLYGSGSPAHIVLPSISLGVVVAAMVGRMTRAAMLDVLNREYVEAARAKGLTERRVVSHHALRNALIPVVTVFGLQFGTLMGGTFVTEVIFAWPGMGRLMISAILERDFPVVQGAAILFLATFFLINLIVDLLYLAIDPRIRQSRTTSV